MAQSADVRAALRGQLIAYLTGPAQQRLPWQPREGADGKAFWRAGNRYGRLWSLHLPDPQVDGSFAAELRRAVATVAAAEQRPLPAVVADIVAAARARTRPAQVRSPAAGVARLVDTWHAAAPRTRAPRVVAVPEPPGELDEVIADVFAAGYHHGWRHRLHQVLLHEGTAALARLDQAGELATPPAPRTVVDVRRLHDQITVAGIERYLTRNGWRPLDATGNGRRWHNGPTGATFVEVPTTGQLWRSGLNAAARTLADLEDRSFGEVLADFTEPALRHEHVARVNRLLTHPPAAADGHVAARMDDLWLESAPGREVSLREFTHQQVADVGATDAVWRAAELAGATDAAEHAAALLATPPPNAPPPRSAVRFCRHPGEAAEQIAARIWAAGGHLPPAAHGRWFARTWWPYHVTGTARATAAHLAARLGHEPPTSERVAPAAGTPSSQLLRAVEKTARPERSSGDRFAAAYRVINPAARQTAVSLAVAITRQHHHGTDAGDAAARIHALAQVARDPRRFGRAPTDQALLDAITHAQPPTENQHQAVRAGDRPQPAPEGRPDAQTQTHPHPAAAAFPPPWRAILAAQRPPPIGSRLLTDPDRSRRRQLVDEAITAITATSGGTHASSMPTAPDSSPPNPLASGVALYLSPTPSPTTATPTSAVAAQSTAPGR